MSMCINGSRQNGKKHLLVICSSGCSRLLWDLWPACACHSYLINVDITTSMKVFWLPSVQLWNYLQCVGRTTCLFSSRNCCSPHLLKASVKECSLIKNVKLCFSWPKLHYEWDHMHARRIPIALHVCMWLLWICPYHWLWEEYRQ